MVIQGIWRHFLNPGTNVEKEQNLNCKEKSILSNQKMAGKFIEFN